MVAKPLRGLSCGLSEASPCPPTRLLPMAAGEAWRSIKGAAPRIRWGIGSTDAGMWSALLPSFDPARAAAIANVLAGLPGLESGATTAETLPPPFPLTLATATRFAAAAGPGCVIAFVAVDGDVLSENSVSESDSMLDWALGNGPPAPATPSVLRTKASSAGNACGNEH